MSGNAWDRTQGPACAVTTYRNCLVTVADGCGHGARRQAPERTRLNRGALCRLESLVRLSRLLAVASAAETGLLRGLLRIELHRDVELTEERQGPWSLVTQAYCWAMPVAYG